MTDAAVVAFIGATGAVVAAVISSRVGTRRQLQEIHILVNSRLSEALDEIRSLKNENTQLKKKR